MKTQMIDKFPTASPEVIDAILDLKHDLGKHIRLPVAMLPVGASDAEIKEAVLRAIARTRSGPSGTRSARAIWSAFAAEVEEALAGRAELDRLREAVERALAWEGRASGEAALDRRALDSDLGAVSARIQELLDEVAHG
jgi:hypothetical protein